MSSHYSDSVGAIVRDAFSATRFFLCPVPGDGSSAFGCSACLMRRSDLCRWPTWRCGARVHMAAACLKAPRIWALIFLVPPRRRFAVALSSVFPVSPATPTSAKSPQAKAEPRKALFYFLIHSRGIDRRPSSGPCPSAARWR